MNLLFFIIRFKNQLDIKHAIWLVFKSNVNLIIYKNYFFIEVNFYIFKINNWRTETKGSIWSLANNFKLLLNYFKFLIFDGICRSRIEESKLSLGINLFNWNWNLDFVFLFFQRNKTEFNRFNFRGFNHSLGWIYYNFIFKCLWNINFIFTSIIKIKLLYDWSVFDFYYLFTHYSDEWRGEINFSIIFYF